LYSSSGTPAGGAINFGALLYLSVTSATHPYEGQGLTATNGGTCVAKSMDQVAVPTDTTTKIVKIRVYLDRLSKAALVV